MNKFLSKFAFRLLTFYGAQLPYHRGKWRVLAFLRKRWNVHIDQDFQVRRGEARWILNPADLVEADLFWIGMKDMWEIYHAKRLLKPGAVILDVGANFGYYAITLAQFLDCRCVVHAFEPNPPVYARLQANIRLNDLAAIVQAHRLGLGDAAATLSILDKPGSSGAARLVADGGSSAVHVVRLDDFVRDHGLSKLDFIKVDIEGFEERFLRGATDTLQKFRPPLMIELCPPVLARQGTSVSAVASLLQAQNYRLFYPCRKQLHPVTDLPNGEDILNAFALPVE